MKKVLAVVTISLLLIGVTFSAASAAERGKVGVGYQGLFTLGSSNIAVNALNLRYRPAPRGALDFMVGYGNIDSDDGGDIDLWMVGVDGMYILIPKEQVDFFVGGGVAYANLDNDDDVDLWQVRAFVGSEFFFTELPEVGFNWKAGLYYQDIEDHDFDVDDWSTFVSVGVNYYF
jgi:hypothetical protein